MKRYSMCPRCRRYVLDHDSYGVSAIYRSQHRICFSCWDAEADEIDKAGTNDRPETLIAYGPPNDFDSSGPSGDFNF